MSDLLYEVVYVLSPYLENALLLPCYIVNSFPLDLPLRKSKTQELLFIL